MPSALDESVYATVTQKDLVEVVADDDDDDEYASRGQQFSAGEFPSVELLSGTPLAVMLFSQFHTMLLSVS